MTRTLRSSALAAGAPKRRRSDRADDRPASPAPALSPGTATALAPVWSWRRPRASAPGRPADAVPLPRRARWRASELRAGPPRLAASTCRRCDLLPHPGRLRLHENVRGHRRDRARLPVAIDDVRDVVVVVIVVDDRRVDHRVGDIHAVEILPAYPIGRPIDFAGRSGNHPTGAEDPPRPTRRNSGRLRTQRAPARRPDAPFADRAPSTTGRARTPNGRSDTARSPMALRRPTSSPTARSTTSGRRDTAPNPRPRDWESTRSRIRERSSMCRTGRDPGNRSLRVRRSVPRRRCHIADRATLPIGRTRRAPAARHTGVAGGRSHRSGTTGRWG